jgi:hypothetical protein
VAKWPTTTRSTHPPRNNVSIGFLTPSMNGPTIPFTRHAWMPHSARECRKRQFDEKTKQEKTSNKTGKEVRNNALQIEDELNLQFSNNVTQVDRPSSERKPMRTSSSPNTDHEEETKGNDNNEENNDSGEEYEEWQEDPVYYSKESSHSLTNESCLNPTENRDQESNNTDFPKTHRRGGGRYNLFSQRRPSTS